MSQCFLISFTCLFCDVVPNLWGLLLLTVLHMLIPHLDSLGRRRGLLCCFLKQVKCSLDAFLIEIDICHQRAFFSGTCHACHCYVFDNLINIEFVSILGCVAVPIPAAKLLMQMVLDSMLHLYDKRHTV